VPLKCDEQSAPEQDSILRISRYDRRSFRRNPTATPTNASASGIMVEGSGVVVNVTVSSHVKPDQRGNTIRRIGGNPIGEIQLTGVSFRGAACRQPKTAEVAVLGRAATPLQGERTGCLPRSEVQLAVDIQAATGSRLGLPHGPNSRSAEPAC
jgi:hypothetical protein